METHIRPAKPAAGVEGGQFFPGRREIAPRFSSLCKIYNRGGGSLNRSDDREIFTPQSGVERLGRSRPRSGLWHNNRSYVWRDPIDKQHFKFLLSDLLSGPRRRGREGACIQYVQVRNSSSRWVVVLNPQVRDRAICLWP